MIYAHLWEPPPLATARQPSLPSAVDSVLARAMSKDPDQRFLTCQEFAEALRAALGLRPYAADPGMSAGEWHHGAGEQTRPAPAAMADDRDTPSVPEPSGSQVAAGPPPASVEPGRAPGGEGAPGGSDRVPPGGHARTRRRAALLSVTALALAALTVAGVVVAMRAPPSPELIGAYKPVPGQLARVSVGLNGQVLGAGYTCGECGTFRETDRPLLVEQNGSAWSRLATPGIPGSSRLTGASVSVDGTIYVVGYSCLADCRTKSEIDRPLILWWRGGVWSKFAPSIPKSAVLTGVSVAAAGTIFAVGYTCNEGCATVLPISDDHPLILRSDGSRWKVVSPNLPDDGTLSAVGTEPDGTAWLRCPGVRLVMQPRCPRCRTSPRRMVASGPGTGGPSSMAAASASLLRHGDPRRGVLRGQSCADAASAAPAHGQAGSNRPRRCGAPRERGQHGPREDGRAPHRGRLVLARGRRGGPCNDRRVQGGRDRRHDRGRTCHRQWPVLAHEPPHITAADQPHGDEQQAPGLACLENRNDMRIIDHRRGARFPDEPAPERPVSPESRREDLYGHLPAQSFVSGPEHHGHAAAPDLLLQAIATEHRADPDTVCTVGYVAAIWR